MTSHSFPYNTKGATLGLASPFPTPEENPTTALPDSDLEGFTKRLRVGDDGSYSPYPSSCASSFYPPCPDSPFPNSPLSDYKGTPASPTPNSTGFSPPPLERMVAIEQNILGPEGKVDDKGFVLGGLVADLSTVFNTRALSEVDQEVCFGMISGTILSTNKNLHLLQEFHTKNPKKSQFLALDLDVSSTPSTKKIQATIDIHSEITILGDLEVQLSITLLPLLNPPLVRIQALTFPPFTISTERRRKRRMETQDIKISMNLYGNLKNKDRIGLFLTKNKIFLQHPKFPDPGHLYHNPHILSRPGALVLVTESTLTGGVIPAGNTKKPVEEEMPVNAASLSKIFDGLCNSEALDELNGDWRLTTPLLSHQKQGLYFLAKREYVGQDSSACQKNFSTRGGILADYMGLGKTLTILSLIVRSLDEARSIIPSTYLSCHWSISREKIRSGATLLIAPVSTLGNWEEQISAHVQPNTLKYCIYYGKDKPTDPGILSKCDIVFTSFQTVTQEWKASRSCRPLYAIRWFRLVLDEAHVIRTQKTNQCQAVCAISAERRWCITGTPLQNDITDIATLFKFLRYEPLNTRENFEHHVNAKIKARDISGMETLRAALKLICLRRTKDTISGRLPARSEHTKFLEFDSDEKTLYDNYKQKLGPMHDSRANAPQVLLSLRLICDHGKDLLPQGELEICCAICGIQLRDWEMGVEGEMPCIHRAICRSCINSLVVTDDKDILGSGCEVCSRRREILGHCIQASFPNYRGPSTKVKALIGSIKQCTLEDISNFMLPSKHVIFSSWTRMLDLVGIALKHNGIVFCRLDGSMQRSQRNQTIAEFSTNPQVTVILVSLMAGGVGINLTCASRVHLLEPHWNPMVEQQAVERVHRLGQCRDVTITRYIMKDSFEIDMMGYQKRKLELARQSLDSKAPLEPAHSAEVGSQGGSFCDIGGFHGMQGLNTCHR